jgi:hypothetical protein
MTPSANRNVIETDSRRMMLVGVVGFRGKWTFLRLVGTLGRKLGSYLQVRVYEKKTLGIQDTNAPAPLD